jgi:hypothetical protein
MAMLRILSSVIVGEFIQVLTQELNEVNAMLSIDRTFVTSPKRAPPLGARFGGLKSNFIQISCPSRLID